MLHFKSELKPVPCSRNILLPMNHAARFFAENIFLDEGAALAHDSFPSIIVCVRENAERTTQFFMPISTPAV